MAVWQNIDNYWKKAVPLNYTTETTYWVYCKAIILQLMKTLYFEDTVTFAFYDLV